MKRDLDLLRAILIEVEAHQDPTKGFAVRAPGYSPSQVAYHVGLLHEAGFIHADNAGPSFAPIWQPRSLTWAGHEFLDATRDGAVWHQVAARLKDRGLEAPVSIVQTLAGKILAATLGLP